MEPLSDVEPGAEVRVIEIQTGRGLRLRLEQLGLFPGARVEVLTNSNGHILVRAMGVLISLSKGIASKILVER